MFKIMDKKTKLFAIYSSLWVGECSLRGTILGESNDIAVRHFSSEEEAIAELFKIHEHFEVIEQEKIYYLNPNNTDGYIPRQIYVLE